MKLNLPLVLGLVTTSLLSFSQTGYAMSDFNNDGYDDVWQHRYSVTPDLLPPDEDEDGDGASNYEESVAGTDPRSAGDRLNVETMAIVGTDVQVSFETLTGKRYSLVSSSSPKGPTWVAEGSPVTGNNATMTITVPMGTGTTPKFYMVKVCDQDSDGDQISDWAESVMGTNPALANSTNNASGGAASDGETLRSLMSITTSVVTPSAFEKEGIKARVRLTRTYGTTMPLTISLTTAGSPDPLKGSASANDYTLQTSTGVAIPGSTITMASGATQYDLLVAPKVETPLIPEVPEILRLSFKADNGSVTIPVGTTCTVDVRDATNTDDNRRLFVSYYGREGGAVTSATGVSTLLLNGDNTQALVRSEFSNLTTIQSASHLHAAPAIDPQNSGPIIESIPLGQVSEHPWSIEAEPAVGWTTDQATLNALHAGYVYINVHSANYPSGEVRGNYTLTSGSVMPPPTPADPPAYGSAQWPALTGDAIDRDIARFLTQATFGPTPESIQEVKNLIAANGNNAIAGYTAWLDQQISATTTPYPSLKTLVEAADVEDFMIRGNRHLNANNDPQFGGASFSWNTGNRTWSGSTIHENNYPNQLNRRREWWTLTLQAKAQLRQRMAFALSQIVVISEADTTVATYHYGAAHYWDMLANNAFGKYRQVLSDVTQHPIMGIYLSHLKNRKASGNITPDENFAREIMQLFSIGLVLRHPDGSLKLDEDGLPIPTYDQEDIRELSRVMTGFGFGKRHAVVNGVATYPNTSNQRIGAVENNTDFYLGNQIRYWQAQWTNPMKIFDAHHDFAAKILFEGKVGQANIPARTDNSGVESEGLADISLALNALAGQLASSTYDGHPNTPMFISRLLIQRFTTSNPSSGYLHRVAQKFRDTNGNLGEVIKAILLDYEARSLSFADNVATAGKPKEPLLHLAAYLRAAKVFSGAPLANLTTMTVPFNSQQSPVTTAYPTSELAKFTANPVRFRFSDLTGSITQSPQFSPSVFNWFLPDYVMPGPLAAAGLVAPELQVATESSVVNIFNYHYSTIFASLPSTTNTNTGRGLDDFPMMASYQNASQVQLANPQYSVNAGYFTATTFDSSPGGTAQPVNISNQKDNLILNYDPLIDSYISLYAASLVDQYAPAAVPTTPGTTQRQVAHAEAVRALVDQYDLLFCGGYLKAKFGSLGTSNPRKSIIDAVNFIAANNRHTSDNTNFRNDARTRIRNIIYLVLSCPQALILK
ncbi:DUF1800 family protein [Phragmitibacter flavus]|uniref:DUF1800 family protein n=1 Tax=Phragmitibacter flavus TaxID=2576071 RepID=A0A5R8KCW2_9BACT|nr:DUF1800 family protein [Phragmitibacter flavus]TLD70123.1 DUF1800 family protein [Phragmitibacter flavus]